MNGHIETRNGQKFEVSNVVFSKAKTGGREVSVVHYDILGGNAMLANQDTSTLLRCGIHKYNIVSGGNAQFTPNTMTSLNRVTMFVRSRSLDLDALESRIVDLLADEQTYRRTESDEDWRQLLGLEVNEHEAFEKAIQRLERSGKIKIGYREGEGTRTQLILE